MSKNAGSEPPSGLRPPPQHRSGGASAVQRFEQGWEVAEAAGAGGVAEALVLRKRVHEAVAHVVAVLVQQAPAGVTRALDHVPDRRVERELSHRPASAPPPPRPGGRATAPAPQAGARRPRTRPSAPTPRRPGPARPSPCPFSPTGGSASATGPRYSPTAEGGATVPNP